MVTWNVRSFRAPGRLLGKLFKGSATAVKAKFFSACLSAIWDCGYNEPLYDILKEIIGGLGNIEGDPQLEMYMAALVKRSPALAGASPVYVPSFADVVNGDASILRPLLDVYWSRRCEEVGSKVGWY